MPEFDLARYVTTRYSKRIEAADYIEAQKVAKALTDEQWGTPDSTEEDEGFVFNLTGDEVGRF